jgi:N-acetyl-anhydromuramyl-L-alanine amidase AmpD
MVGGASGDINTLTGHDPSHLVSSHFYIESNGKIRQYVNTKDTAYGAGDRNSSGINNADTINIEQQHVDGKDKWNKRQVTAATKLVAQQLKEHPELSLPHVSQPGEQDR